MSAVALTLSGCVITPQRWPQPEPSSDRIAYHPVCTRFSAPLLTSVPDEGVVPAYLFRLRKELTGDEVSLRKGLDANGFTVGNGTVTINKARILFAVGRGRLKTQPMADRLYRLMCALETKEIRLVHVRYNMPAEANRMN